MFVDYYMSGTLLVTRYIIVRGKKQRYDFGSLETYSTVDSHK